MKKKEGVTELTCLSVTTFSNKLVARLRRDPDEEESYYRKNVLPDFVTQGNDYKTVLEVIVENIRQRYFQLMLFEVEINDEEIPEYNVVKEVNAINTLVGKEYPF